MIGRNGSAAEAKAEIIVFRLGFAAEAVASEVAAEAVASEIAAETVVSEIVAEAVASEVVAEAVASEIVAEAVASEVIAEAVVTQIVAEAFRRCACLLGGIIRRSFRGGAIAVSVAVSGGPGGCKDCCGGNVP